MRRVSIATGGVTQWLVAALVLFFTLGGLAPSTAQDTPPQETAMLAVTGADGNIYLYDSEGKNPLALTSDAVTDRKLYSWPTWATDGRLAFFGISIDPADPYTLRVFIQRDARAGGAAQIAYSDLGKIFTYAYWSPGNCPANAGDTDCRDLALLYTPASQDGLEVELIRQRDSGFETIFVDRGAPFYYSFSPSGQQMLWHRFSQQLEIYDVPSGQASLLPDVPGAFQSPMWSPVDDQLLFALMGSTRALADVVIAPSPSSEARTVILKDARVPVSMAWSPDAQKVAITNGEGALAVVDLANGKTVAPALTQPVIAYFWSPLSNKIALLSLARNSTTPVRYQQTAYLNGHTAYSPYPQQPPSTRPRQQNVPALALQVYDLASNTVSLLATFVPTGDMIYLLNFFDQFSRSHRLWSPDGRYFAYGAIDSISGKAQVLLAVVDSPGQTSLVGEGTIGIWRWQ
jgi:TolB protein